MLRSRNTINALTIAIAIGMSVWTINLALAQEWTENCDYYCTEHLPCYDDNVLCDGIAPCNPDQQTEYRPNGDEVYARLLSDPPDGQRAWQLGINVKCNKFYLCEDYGNGCVCGPHIQCTPAYHYECEECPGT